MIEIVKFKDGNFAIRKKGFFTYKYLSLRRDYWWSEAIEVNNYCKANLDKIKERLRGYKDKGTPIEEEK